MSTFITTCHAVAVGNGQRRHGRLPVESVRSQPGQVLDLSRGGARIEVKRVPRGCFPIEFTDGQREVCVFADVVWARRTGLFRHEVGLRFEELTPDQASQLNQLAMTNWKRRTM